ARREAAGNPGHLLRQVPDADGDVVADAAPLALRLRDPDQPALGGREPLVDVVFVRRIPDGFALAAAKSKYLHPFLHDLGPLRSWTTLPRPKGANAVPRARAGPASATYNGRMARARFVPDSQAGRRPLAKARRASRRLHPRRGLLGSPTMEFRLDCPCGIP